MATGIKDKVAILGMGCAKFGERWNDNAEDLMVEAFIEALEDSGIEKNDIQAAWFSTAIEEQHVGKSGVPLAMALRLPFIPVTRVENYCASGSEAFRGAVYAVASGACDIALALGVALAASAVLLDVPEAFGDRLPLTVFTSALAGFLFWTHRRNLREFVGRRET